MTTRSEPGDGRPDPSLSAIIRERRQLINLAYRLPRSRIDAEDAVQEAYARWYAMSHLRRLVGDGIDLFDSVEQLEDQGELTEDAPPQVPRLGGPAAPAAPPGPFRRWRHSRGYSADRRAVLTQWR
jgi:Sigma-70 region 2